MDPEIRKRYQAVIGLEVHMQLSTRSKLFTTERFVFGAPANSLLSPITFAHPGALPSLNRSAIHHAVKLGLAIGSEVNTHTFFDRKNYFYPDLPKGYQMSQDREPICIGGRVRFRVGKEVKEIQVHHLHLEEDAGKSLHDQHPAESYIDLNRAGVPLIELVTEPDFRSAQEAAAFMSEMRTLVRYLEISDGDMEKGNLRCDANVSVMPVGATKYGTRAEIKNMNAMSFLTRAVNYEIERQIKILESGGKVIQETRTYDVDRQITLSMRDKESADDYRYFPEPDLLPVQIKEEEIATIRAEIPRLPLDRYLEYHQEFGISENEALSLVEQKSRSDYFEAFHPLTSSPKVAANWLMGPVREYLNQNQLGMGDFPLSMQTLAALTQLVESGKVNYNVAKGQLFEALIQNPQEEPLQLAGAMNLIVETDGHELNQLMEQLMEKHPQEVERYRKGKKGLKGFFVGQMMRQLKGKADPKAVNEVVREKLDHWDN